MNKAIEKLLDRNRAEHPRLRDQRLREVLQVIVLMGLKRADFFEIASFYGGTALRLLHGLDRFSEDLDFCINPGMATDFDFKSYFPAIEQTLASFGFQMTVTAQEKAQPTPIQSAFVKGNTYVNYLAIGEARRGMHPGQVTKVKIEIDTENPEGATREMAPITEPEPFLVHTLDLNSLFAGKLHAIIAREMDGRVKGRDFYDFLHFIGRGAKVNLRYLRAKLIDSNHLGNNESFDMDVFKAMLIEKIRSTNFKYAVEDVSPFIYSEQKRSELKHWNVTFFEAFSRILTQAESQDYPQAINNKDDPEWEYPDPNIKQTPSVDENHEKIRCKVCGVVIRKGSKTTEADLDAELCSKHRARAGLT
ncbi:MAG: nucleotidyl transferase AbiEii/AbiGii toxin family protein [Oligoflexus sp.]